MIILTNNIDDINSELFYSSVKLKTKGIVVCINDTDLHKVYDSFLKKSLQCNEKILFSKDRTELFLPITDTYVYFMLDYEADKIRAKRADIVVLYKTTFTENSKKIISGHLAVTQNLTNKGKEK